MVKNKTHEAFVLEVFEVLGNEYEVVGKYTNARTKVAMKHKECGRIYESMPRSILRGSGCNYPDCKYKNRAMSHDDFIHRFQERANGEYELLSAYKDSRSNITLKHTPCGEVFDIRANSFIQGVGCRTCGLKVQLNNNFSDEVAELTNGRFAVVGDYMNSRTKVQVKHLECGLITEVFPTDFKNRLACKHCSMSYGEIQIRKFLEDNQVKFRQEYKFDDLIHKSALRFDFAIFDEDRISCLVEFDGVQHYQPIERFGGKQTFEQTKIRDELKNKYCKENGITLVRIPYYKKKEIPEIMSKLI